MNPNQSSLDATYQTCTATNILTAPPLTSRQGMTWVMGEMCCSAYNHCRTTQPDELRGIPFPGNMANMSMQVPPSSNHPGGVNVMFGDGSVPVHQEQCRPSNLAEPGYAQRR